MDIKPGFILKDWQKDDPLIWSRQIRLEIKSDYSEMLLSVFGSGKSRRLITWERNESDFNGPHWIGVRNGTPLHTDPRYQRYTHQLVVRNDGFDLGGFGDARHSIATGTLFCMDTHSPHAIVKNDRNTGLYYLAASMDSKEVLSAGIVQYELERFIYARLG